MKYVISPELKRTLHAYIYITGDESQHEMLRKENATYTVRMMLALLFIDPKNCQ